jgi:hypothetical protein
LTPLWLGEIVGQTQTFMLRLILIVIAGMFVAVGVLAVALFHFFGWKGLVAFPLVMLVFAWLAIRLIKFLFKRFALKLIGMKSRALRGATMNIHSVRSVPKPAESRPQTPDQEEEDTDAEDGDADNAKTENAVAKTNEPVSPKDYVEVDVTITPKGKAANPVWEPSELVLTSKKVKNLADLGNSDVGCVHSLEVWQDSGFGPDDPGKYEGERRLKIIFEVKPGADSAWLNYYNESIGQLKLPVGTIEV